MKKFIVQTLALAAGTTAFAQSINVDVGNNTTYPLASAALAAGAGNAGTWNAVSGTGAATSAALVDITGAATTVTVTRTGGTNLDLANALIPAGTDDEKLMKDISDPGTSATWTFNNLAAGNYILYTYGWAPDSPAFKSNIVVAGSVDGAQAVGGTWTGSYTALLTHAVHHVTVAPAGTIAMTISAAVSFGSLNGFQIRPDVPAAPGIAFCFPGVDAMACPCLNPGGVGKGCANNGPLDDGTSGAGGGGSLSSAGVADLSLDAVDPGSMSLTGTGMYAGTACIFAMGPAVVAGGSIAFGAGVRCAGGSLVRLYTKTGANFTGGSATAPQPADRSISNRTVDLGAAPIVPGTYYFQTYYRDPNIVAPFVTPANPGCPANFTFNMTSGQQVVWVP